VNALDRTSVEGEGLEKKKKKKTKNTDLALGKKGTKVEASKIWFQNWE